MNRTLKWKEIKGWEIFNRWCCLWRSISTAAWEEVQQNVNHLKWTNSTLWVNSIHQIENSFQYLNKTIALVLLMTTWIQTAIHKVALEAYKTKRNSWVRILQGHKLAVPSQVTISCLRKKESPCPKWKWYRIKPYSQVRLRQTKKSLRKLVSIFL